jgi:hypothetical protein
MDSSLDEHLYEINYINERDVIIWDDLIAIISRNILRKFLGIA